MPDIKYAEISGMDYEQKIIFFEQNLKSTESLYLGPIPKEQLLFTGSDITFEIIKTFFHKEKFHDRMEKKDIDRAKNLDFENFIKLCWLTDEYFKNYEFNNPITAHYNPTLKNNVIHPGGTRNQVLNLFHQGPIKSFYFNTGGVRFSWMSALDTISIRDLGEIHLALTEDHGSIIPHIHLDRETIVEGIYKYQSVIAENLENLKVKSNIPFKIFPTNPEVTDYNVIIEFKSAPSIDDICRAIILSALKKNYNSTELVVKTL